MAQRRINPIRPSAVLDEHARETMHRRQFVDEKLRHEHGLYQEIIASADSKANTLTQLLAALATLAGVVVAVVVGRVHVHVSPAAVAFGLISLLSLIAAFVSLAKAMWPRLGGLPHDASGQQLLNRISASVDGDEHDYARVFGAQRIAWIKNRAIRIVLISMLCMVASAASACALLFM